MSDRPPGFGVDPEGGELLSIGGADYVIKASAESTGGAFTLIEEIAPLDTPLHVHSNEDELFYVVEGTHVFRLGDEEIRLGPGGLAFAPRGTPHAHRRVVPRQGRFLIMSSPAGFERFFRDLERADRERTLAESWDAISAEHGLTWLDEEQTPQEWLS